MKILVCGSEGRLMSATIPHLLKQGHQIIGVDTCEKWGSHEASRSYQFAQGNCCDAGFLRPWMRGVDGVIQAAATLFGVMGFHRRGADILSNDVRAHQTVLSLSAELRVGRVVYMSSSMVYERCHTEPYREEDADEAQSPATEYGLSKLVGERLSRAYFKQYGLPFTIWRPFNVIDPSETGSEDAGVSHVFADLIYRLIGCGQNPVDIIGDGEQVRSFVHLREIGEALAMFSFDERTRNETYNLGRNEIVTMKALASRIYERARARGMVNSSRELKFRSLPAPVTDVRRRVGSFEKAQRDLNWKSKIPLDTSLDECLNYFGSKHPVTPASCPDLPERSSGGQ